MGKVEHWKRVCTIPCGENNIDVRDVEVEYVLHCTVVDVIAYCRIVDHEYNASSGCNSSVSMTCIITIINSSSISSSSSISISSSRRRRRRRIIIKIIVYIDDTSFGISRGIVKLSYINLS